MLQISLRKVGAHTTGPQEIRWTEGPCIRPTLDKETGSYGLCDGGDPAKAASHVPHPLPYSSKYTNTSYVGA